MSKCPLPQAGSLRGTGVLDVETLKRLSQQGFRPVCPRLTREAMRWVSWLLGSALARRERFSRIAQPAGQPPLSQSVLVGQRQ